MLGEKTIIALLAVSLLGCGTFAGYSSDTRSVGISVAIGTDTSAPNVEGGTLSSEGAGVLTSIACTMGNTILGWFGRDPVCTDDTDETTEEVES